MEVYLMMLPDVWLYLLEFNCFIDGLQAVLVGMVRRVAGAFSID